MLSQKTFCTVQKALLDFNKGFILSLSTSLMLFDNLVHDWLVIDCCLQGLGVIHLKKVLNTPPSNAIVVIIGDTTISLIASGGLILIHLSFKFAEVVYSVAFVLGHITHVPHKLHLRLKLSHTLRPVKV